MSGCSVGLHPERQESRERQRERGTTERERETEKDKQSQTHVRGHDETTGRQVRRGTEGKRECNQIHTSDRRGLFFQSHLPASHPPPLSDQIVLLISVPLPSSPPLLSASPFLITSQLERWESKRKAEVKHTAGRRTQAEWEEDILIQVTQ